MKSYFIEGPVPSAFIGEAIAKHQVKTGIGAHDIFLGQVRADTIDGNVVAAIDYSAYEEMANKKFSEIREKIIPEYGLSCMHIYHSKGLVKAGEICLFVFVSAPHRKATFRALEAAVELIKSEVPVFGKEIFEDSSYQWKVNQ